MLAGVRRAIVAVLFLSFCLPMAAPARQSQQTEPVPQGKVGTPDSAPTPQVQPAPVSSAPTKRVPLVIEFPPGVESVDIPSQFDGQHVIIRLMVNGRGLDLALDTGAGAITLDQQVATELGLTAYGQKSAQAAQRYTTANAVLPEVHIGALTIRDVVVNLTPNTPGSYPGVKPVGLLGYDFLSQLGVTIDYEHRRVTVVPKGAYVPPTDDHVIPLDVRLTSHVPMVDVTINGAVGTNFIIDTGGIGSFMIFDRFARQHAEALVDLGGGGNQRQSKFIGIGGSFSTRPYQLKSVRIGPFNLVDFVGFRVTSDSYQGDSDGIIGSEFLRVFTLGLDYANNRIYLVPNTIGRRAMNLPN